MAPASRLNGRWTRASARGVLSVIAFLLWLIVLLLCWPLALVALVLYPIVWLITLPLRLVGIAVGGALRLVWLIVTLPFRILGLRP